MAGSDEEGDAEFLEAFMGKANKKAKKDKAGTKGAGVEIKTKSDGSPIVSYHIFLPLFCYSYVCFV